MSVSVEASAVVADSGGGESLVESGTLDSGDGDRVAMGEGEIGVPAFEVLFSHRGLRVTSVGAVEMRSWTGFGNAPTTRRRPSKTGRMEARKGELAVRVIVRQEPWMASIDVASAQ